MAGAGVAGSSACCCNKLPCMITVPCGKTIKLTTPSSLSRTLQWGCYGDRLDHTVTGSSPIESTLSAYGAGFPFSAEFSRDCGNYSSALYPQPYWRPWFKVPDCSESINLQRHRLPGLSLATLDPILEGIYRTEAYRYEIAQRVGGVSYVIYFLQATFSARLRLIHPSATEGLIAHVELGYSGGLYFQNEKTGGRQTLARFDVSKSRRFQIGSGCAYAPATQLCIGDSGYGNNPKWFLGTPFEVTASVSATSHGGYDSVSASPSSYAAMQSVMSAIESLNPSVTFRITSRDNCNVDPVCVGGPVVLGTSDYRRREGSSGEPCDASITNPTACAGISFLVQWCGMSVEVKTDDLDPSVEEAVSQTIGGCAINNKEMFVTTINNQYFQAPSGYSAECSRCAVRFQVHVLQYTDGIATPGCGFRGKVYVVDWREDCDAGPHVDLASGLSDAELWICDDPPVVTVLRGAP